MENNFHYSLQHSFTQVITSSANSDFYYLVNLRKHSIFMCVLALWGMQREWGNYNRSVMGGNKCICI